MMPRDDPETWRAELEQSGLPPDVPLVFDSTRWTRDTVLRAEAALHRAPPPRRWRYGLGATAAAAALVALSTVVHPAVGRSPSVGGRLAWPGKGPLSQLDMVTPSVGWAVPWRSPGWLMYTSTGLGGFHPLVRVGNLQGATSWTPVGTTSLVVTTGMPGKGAVRVLRLSASGRPAIRTDVAPSGAGGQSLEGWTSWTSPQRGLLYIVAPVPHGGYTWVYRTQSGGRSWHALPLAVGVPPHAGLMGSIGRVLFMESGGSLYRSSNKGRVFSRVAVAPPAGWNGPWSLSAALLRGTGSQGVLVVPSSGNVYIYTSRNAGTSWHFDAVLPHEAHPQLTGSGSHDLWTYSLETASLWRSTNGGASWQSLGVPAPFDRLRAGGQWLLTSIQFVSATTGFALWQRREVVGAEAGTAVYETVDGGAQWFSVPRFDGAPPVKP